MEFLLDPQIWIALITLTLLEIVLGVDNIIFISILSQKLPKNEQGKARVVGLGLAMFMRVALLFSMSWVMGLTQPLLEVLNYSISGRDLILFFGGMFLIAKSTHEIHGTLEGDEKEGKDIKAVSFLSVLVQILLLDIIFSLDSVITAVGMVDQLSVMVVAVVIAVIFMMFFSGTVSRFIDKHPTIKMLALSFLILVGFALMAESFNVHVPKGYIYFAMAFSVFVEVLNLKIRTKGTPVALRKVYKNS